jgi:hypothetical protein
MESGETEKTAKKVKDPKARCVYCRKCYNSGLCMVPWPGLPEVESKKVFNKAFKKS